jgi:hypothetical protein
LLNGFEKGFVCPWGSKDNSGCGIPAGYPPIVSINLLLVTRLLRDEG